MLPCPLPDVETWVFDLDNTLYPGTATIYREVEERMTAFIMAELRLDRQKAEALRQRYFAEHGTTLRGLMMEHGLPPQHFLDYVHELDLSSLAANETLVQALAALPGRKLVFTNASVRHAERVLDRLGLAMHISGIHDVAACDYVAKPHPQGYDKLLRRFAIAPRRAAMVEDMARNLAPAAALGMTTIWVKGGPHQAEEDATAPHVHHVVETLAPWLDEIASAGRSRPIPAAG
jgi:putative hydrolase of the HAD superfamily